MDTPSFFAASLSRAWVPGSTLIFFCVISAKVINYPHPCKQFISPKVIFLFPSKCKLFALQGIRAYPFTGGNSAAVIRSNYRRPIPAAAGEAYLLLPAGLEP